MGLVNTNPTPIQQAVLDFIRNCVDREGRPPTQTEIAEHFGWASHSGVRCHLKALRRKGYIRQDGHGVCDIRLVGHNVAARRVRLPLVADIAAGLPTDNELWLDEFVEVDASLFPRPAELFALRVRGQSMTGAGIFDGDRLIVRRAVEARTGQIVVARIDNETTVKRLVLKPPHVILRPENSQFRDIVVPPDSDFAVQGIAIGSVRVF